MDITSRIITFKPYKVDDWVTLYGENYEKM